MSSLLTNNSAMIALQTLKTINKDMGSVQNQISTGKRIANARDNAALWGISTTMQTDVSGFKAIGESLSLGSATLSVARDAAETITSLLDTLKGKIVAAQEENVDRNKIQADVTALRDQINTVVNAAQFNGLNLLNGTDSVNVLASLDRSESGDVASSSITFSKQDLTTTAAVFNTGATGVNDLSAAITVADASLNAAGGTKALTVSTAATAAGLTRLTVGGVDLVVETAIGTATDVAVGITAAINDNAQLKALKITATNAAGVITIQSNNSFDNIAVGVASSTATGVTFGADNVAGNVTKRAEAVAFTARSVSEGDGYRVTLGSTDYTYVARKGDNLTDVVNGLAVAINGDATAVEAGLKAKVDTSGATPTLLVDNGTGVAVAITDDARGGSTAAGGLRGLESLDVTTADGAKAALARIEGLIQASISAAAEFGSSQGRIQTQGEFVSKIMDGLTSGIGTLVDADMEAASARLQALQVQQQLGIQALSIANQQPQNILALFR
jgi:flagellin